MRDAAGIVLLVAVVLPFAVFWSVKFGVYAYYKGKSLFDKENNDGEKSQG